MTANTKKALSGAGALFVLFYVFSQPTQSADVTRDGFGLLEDGGNNFVTFFEELTR